MTAAGPAVTQPQGRPLRVSAPLVVGFGLLFMVLVAGVLGALWTPYDPVATDFSSILEAPNSTHWLGTDEWGRDVLSRILSGATVSISVALAVVFFSVAIGLVLGSVAGYYGGWFDRILVAVNDGLLAFPGFLLAMFIVAVFGPSNLGLIGALTANLVPKIFRVVRSSSRSIKELEFVQASLTMGNSHFYTLSRHVVPNCLTPMIILAAAQFGSAILSESALSFLGLGVPPPTPTWGSMLAESRSEYSAAPWLAIFPGLGIFLAVLGANLAGDGLRDLLDPRYLKRDT